MAIFIYLVIYLFVYFFILDFIEKKGGCFFFIFILTYLYLKKLENQMQFQEGLKSSSVEVFSQKTT